MNENKKYPSFFFHWFRAFILYTGGSGGVVARGIRWSAPGLPMIGSNVVLMALLWSFWAIGLQNLDHWTDPKVPLASPEALSP